MGVSGAQDEDAVGDGGRLVGIREDRVVAGEGLGEFLVGGGIVGRDREVNRSELADPVTALPERLALRRSTPGEGLGKPRQHDGLAAELGQLMGLPVGAL